MRKITRHIEGATCRWRRKGGHDLGSPARKRVRHEYVDQASLKKSFPRALPASAVEIKEDRKGGNPRP